MDITELNEDNFTDFISLLHQRGETPNDFYLWKFINAPYRGNIAGFIAYENKQALGCIGNVNKVLIHKDGNAEPATWFSDWYIIPHARGKGIGKDLMSKVAQSAKTGCGIPGPARAQAVAGKAGYKPLVGFVEIKVPINPWRVGYKRFGGSVLYKIVRGLREMGDSTHAIKTKKCAGTTQPGFPQIDSWLLAVEKGLRKIVHFQRSRTFLEWFRAMPLKTGTARNWWYYDSDEMFATGFTETDIWGLQRSKVMELIPLKLSMADALKNLFYLLNKSTVDMVVLLLHNDTADELGIPVKWRSLIPLHITTTAEVNPGYLSLMDKESSWRDFNFS